MRWISVMLLLVSGCGFNHTVRVTYQDWSVEVSQPIQPHKPEIAHSQPLRSQDVSRMVFAHQPILVRVIR